MWAGNLGKATGAQCWSSRQGSQVSEAAPVCLSASSTFREGARLAGCGEVEALSTSASIEGCSLAPPGTVYGINLCLSINVFKMGLSILPPCHSSRRISDFALCSVHSEDLNTQQTAYTATDVCGIFTDT